MGVLKGSITVHVGSWDGPTRILTIPQFYGIAGSTQIINYQNNVSFAIAAHPEIINDVDYTIIATNRVNDLIEYGFTDVLDVSAYSSASPLLLYVSETSYFILFKANNNVSVNAEITGVGNKFSVNFDGRYRGMSFPSYATGITDECAGYYSMYGQSTSGHTFNMWYEPTDLSSMQDFWEGYTPPPPPPTDPYADGGTSTTGGGDGSFNLQNDSIDFPSLPTLSAVDTGLVSIYTPSLAQLKALATFLWNANPTDVDWWKKLVANPLDLILGLSIVPVQVPQGTAQTIKVGMIDTGVSVTRAARQFVTVDCGSVTIQKNCGGSALDFSPFTKFSLYLPFIGTRAISCDDIMGRTVHVKYNVDLLSGGCTAMVKITGGPDDNQLDAILYQYSGACAISIPLTGETFTNMITSTIQLAASIGATVATGGAAAGVTAASAANSLMSMKPIVERAGGVSGAAGQLGIMRPYLIAEVPRQSVPVDCNKFTGYPSNMKATIGDLTGYTEIEIIHLQGIEATQAELDELETILKGGFII